MHTIKNFHQWLIASLLIPYMLNPMELTENTPSTDSMITTKNWVIAVTESEKEPINFTTALPEFSVHTVIYPKNSAPESHLTFFEKAVAEVVSQEKPKNIILYAAGTAISTVIGYLAKSFAEQIKIVIFENALLSTPLTPLTLTTIPFILIENNKAKSLMESLLAKQATIYSFTGQRKKTEIQLRCALKKHKLITGELLNENAVKPLKIKTQIL